MHYTVSRLPALSIRAHVVLYNQIVLFISLYWMAGEDVSLFLSVLLGGDARARAHAATSSWESSDSDRHVAILVHAIGACRWECERNRVLILCE